MSVIATRNALLTPPDVEKPQATVKNAMAVPGQPPLTQAQQQMDSYLPEDPPGTRVLVVRGPHGTQMRCFRDDK